MEVNRRRPSRPVWSLVIGIAVMVGCGRPVAEPGPAEEARQEPVAEQPAAPAEPRPIVCDEDVVELDLSADEKALVDGLWEQTLTYLRGFAAAIEGQDGCLDSARAITQTYDPKTDGIETRCLTRYRDVQLNVKHVRWVLAHPDEARACFDAQKAYEAFTLYTPTEAMKRASKVAAWLDRPTLEGFYADRDDAVGAAGRELVKNFEAILKNQASPFAGADVTYAALPDLWTAVGWLPFYADNEKAINTRFRGGYAYAEVMGPWGLLRIESIEGEPVGAEIGMTIQMGGSYYPYHFHHPQEVYMTLSPCTGENEFMVMHWDNPSFEQERRDDGWNVLVDWTKHADATWYRPQSPREGQWLTYFERNAIHANTVGEECGDAGAAPGLTAVWARTTARDNTQTTRICVPVDAEGNEREGVTEVGPRDRFVCRIEDWQP